MSHPAVLTILDSSLLLKDKAVLLDFGEALSDDGSRRVHSLISKVVQGSHIAVMREFDGSALSKEALMQLSSKPDAFDAIHDNVLEYVMAGADEASRKCRCLESMVLAVAYLEVFCQSNYTGPELLQASLQYFQIDEDGVNNCIQELECDGNYAFRIVEVPQTLLVARSMLLTLCDPANAGWKAGIELDEGGNISLKKLTPNETIQQIMDLEVSAFLPSLPWWGARATVLHTRLLQKQSYEHLPTLWTSSQLLFASVLQNYCGLDASVNITSVDKEEAVAASSRAFYRTMADCIGSLQGVSPQLEEKLPQICRHSATQAWLEWGLCNVYFSFGDKGKKVFQRAKAEAGLQAELRASMGKRTKSQHTAYAQLFLYAKSSFGYTAPPPAPSGTMLKVAAAPPVEGEPEEGIPDVPGEGGSSGWQHGEFELGRRMVREAENGEEAAVREVLLDSQDGGAQENNIIEGGPKFSDEVVDRGGELHPVDQAVVLALCLDVGNSNPVDGLTNEEMQPYLERVLDLAANWMIHSTALLERSWLEFERRKTMDRAMLQIQALIDQHTTKLTMFQASYKCIEDSAPVQDRLLYLYGIVYPAQYELKRDLAMRYLRCHVFVSALSYFRELEMWDEVVTCYQLLDKPHRAELVVREQLAKSGETPYMLTSLADLTGKTEYYEKAWELSKGRFPRAKRTLGKMCYDKGDFAASIRHLDAALAVQPLVATAWYLKGLACMRLEMWDDALQSFVRCVQQDMEIGEAWANIGAIYMRLRSWAKAYHALEEALRHKRDSWKITENIMAVSLAMGRWRDVIRFMNYLLDMRNNSKRPVHKDELRHLSFIISSNAQREFSKSKKSQPSEPTPSTVPLLAGQELSTLLPLLVGDEDDDPSDILEVVPLPDLVELVEKLLIKVTNALKSDAEIWDMYSEFEHKLGRFRTELECRMKQVRALINDEGWEKFLDKIDGVAAASVFLVKAHYFTGLKKTDVYSTRMLLQSTLRKMDATPVECPAATESLRDLISRLSAVYDVIQ
ncbi:hypothetical protein B484DRAFT_453130 [Ochromonadaceae sp. CCMP2298]|nr:hypothetical protein B484DRAFT_453130 [Ochromonadaceae sp. CCMP2298]|mmetsp:Transcript_10685/g.23382  ORF Transcript_10685/g.23382 Transcript_10685/m.23382 type:complete len:1020 (-) Transcript_10685:85-3144(-)